ncbi:MAG TPA: PVC-type heme-binding CxxCH protein [Tepidisphaeraceae bacterium]|nr:PVC-type heme-binding CxxCH protein [Tepidisphaeraceae bacterium]
MNRKVCLALLVSVVLSVGAVVWARSGQDAHEAKPAGPRRVKVLFLGDNGHHEPLERCRDVYSVLGKRGIDITYTDDLGDLNSDTLGRYDVLLLYANWTTISPTQEKALLDFVESGHGLAAIHCASYCFLNSPRITALIGARFKSHNTGTFKETIVEPDHPIEKGLNPIESWDETYVHEMHNEKDRQVLAYRVQGDHREPYTWTRTQGRGRVFYTAWGHDGRTWTNADFDALLERGIRWAAGEWALALQPKLTPFTYVEAKIPNYVPGARWGTTAAPLTQMQEPVSPPESMKHMVVPPGFELKLVTSEPDVKKPISMAFDERGRLWIAETFDYPNNMQRAGQGHDQITICQDTKGTGVADKFTVFADKLSIPTSIVFANGGIIVAQAPDMLFLKDSTGGDHADVRKVLYHGWGTRDTHAGPSNLRWGFDNWIYGTVGYSGFDGTVNGEHVQFGEGVFRMKPDGSKLEFLGTTSNNTWGVGLSEDGNVFGSTANGDPAWYLAIPNRYYEQVPSWPATRLESTADNWHFWAITDKVRQVDWFGGYTAGAGSALYTARSFPKNYWNRVAFVSEPTGHIVGQFELLPRGSDYVARNNFNILASDDEWTAPIAAEVGPDGALWIIDWYNYIVQHNPIPRGWVSGRGGAYETPLRDKRHGRIYRLVWTAGTPSKSFDLSKASNEQLLEALKSDNLLWRMHAQRLLVERGDMGVIPALLKLALDRSMDQIGLNPTAIHALWTIQGLGGFDGKNSDATAASVADLHHPCAAVRKAAVNVLPRDSQSIAAILNAKMLEDPDAQVRKGALLALTEMPVSSHAGAAAYAALVRKQDEKDHFIQDAATLAGAHHDVGFLKAAIANHPRTSATASADAQPTNLIANPSFEDIDPNPKDFAPLGWTIRDYSGQATHSLDQPGHTGSYCLKITSDNGADASAFVSVKVEPNANYRLSGWIKTRGLEPLSGLGALLNVHELQSPRVMTRAVIASTDWQQVEVEFNTASLSTIGINCLFGGWGRAKGTAYFDDIRLVKLGGAGLPAAEARAVRLVAAQYASRAPSDSIDSLLAVMPKADPAVVNMMLHAMASSWPKDKVPTPTTAQDDLLGGVMGSLPDDLRSGLLELAARWRRVDLFPSQYEAVMNSLKATLKDPAASVAGRIDAARQLIAIYDAPPTAQFILKQISPTEPPDVQVGLLDALSLSRDESLGALLVEQYPQLTPAAQRQLMNILIRRARWTRDLLDGIHNGQVNSRDLLPQQWSALRSNPDERISSRARELQRASGFVPTADRKAIVDKFLPVAQKPGNAETGKAVFEQNCMVCHTLEGRGGKVGPDLTGIGAKPAADLLHKVLDPNSSVEGTYRQWIVRTKGGDVIAGRIYAENRASLQLIDATAQLHEVQRSDIDRLLPTSKTLMPEGFEQLGEQKLADLLSYLGRSKVKR